jgi:hypothetical protein
MCVCVCDYMNTTEQSKYTFVYKIGCKPLACIEPNITKYAMDASYFNHVFYNIKIITIFFTRYFYTKIVQVPQFEPE